MPRSRSSSSFAALVAIVVVVVVLVPVAAVVIQVFCVYRRKVLDLLSSAREKLEQKQALHFYFCSVWL